jgi:hypothetical protein
VRTAICSLVVGDRYERLFREFVFETWQNYSTQHGYELHIFRKPFVELPGKSWAWQKLFILDQPETRGFDRILWLDSDILIKAGSPPVEAPDGLIGYVIDVRRYQTVSEWYAQFNLPSAREVVQTGVLLLQLDHSEILKSAADYSETHMYEMPALSRCLSNSNLGHHLDPRFNAVINRLLLNYVPHRILKNKPLKELLWIMRYSPLRKGLHNICEENWFLHAAGAKRDLLKVSRFLATSNK